MAENATGTVAELLAATGEDVLVDGGTSNRGGTGCCLV